MSVVLATASAVGCSPSPEAAARTELAARGVDLTNRQLVAALTEGDDELARLLLEAGVNAPGAPARLVRAGRCDRIAFLVEAGGSVDDLSGARGLLVARQRDDLDCVERLEALGASVTARAGNGDTLLSASLRNEEREELSRLIEAGFPVDATNRNGETGLVTAARLGAEASILTLLEAGADPNPLDIDGWGALAYAARDGLDQALDALLAAGADPNARDLAGWTPLHWAAHSGDRPAVASLLGAGADPNSLSPAAGSPLILAVRRGDDGIVEQLLAAGAEREAALDGLAPADWARATGHPAVAALLAQTESGP